MSKSIQVSGCRSLAFTLVELLAVFAVLAVLAAILIPAVSGVRKKSMAATCVSNMRQIGTALPLYSNEHGGRLPGPFWPNQGVVYRSRSGQIIEEGHLIAFLVPYLDGSSNEGYHNLDVFLCPAWLESKGYDAGEYVPKGVPFQAETRYFGHARSNPDLQTDPKMMSDVPDPSRVAAFFETDALDGTYYGNTGSNRLAESPVHGSYRHYLFFDGSVRAIGLEGQEAQQAFQSSWQGF